MVFGDAEEGCSYQRLEMTNAATGPMTNASRTGPTTEFVPGSTVTDATTASPTIDAGHRKCCPPWVRRFCAESESDSRGRCLLVTTVIASLLISTAALYQVVTGMKNSLHPEARVSVKGFQLVGPNRATVALRLKNIRAACLKVELTNAQLMWTPRVWESDPHSHRNATTLYGDSLNAWIWGTTEGVQRWSMEESQKHLYVALEMNVVFDEADLPMRKATLFLGATVETRTCDGRNAKKTKKRITVSLG